MDALGAVFLDPGNFVLAEDGIVDRRARISVAIGKVDLWRLVCQPDHWIASKIDAFYASEALWNLINGGQLNSYNDGYIAPRLRKLFSVSAECRNEYGILRVRVTEDPAELTSIRRQIGRVLRNELEDRFESVVSYVLLSLPTLLRHRARLLKMSEYELTIRADFVEALGDPKFRRLAPYDLCHRVLSKGLVEG